MIRQPNRMDDVWSQPPGAAVRRAIDLQVAELARWLKRAGAEPRLGLVLCAGKGARHRLMTGLATHDVQVVSATSTDQRPLPKNVIDHKGDHFNDTLFVLDGFESTSAEAQFAVLEGQRGLLKRTATWVVVMVESLNALDRLYAAAPGLCLAFQRRFVVLAAGAPDTPEAVDPGRLLAWRRRSRVAELVFHAALTPSAPPDADDFSRLVSSGYVNDHVGRPGHPDFGRLVALWAAGADRAAMAAGQLADRPGPALASALARQIDDFSPAQRITLLGGLAHDPLGAARVASAALARGEALPGGLLPEGWPTDLAWLRAATENPEILDAPGLSAIRGRLAASADQQAATVAVAIHLSLAAASAGEGDLDGVVAAVASAMALLPELPLELAFEVLDKHAALQTWRNDRAGARAAVDRMELVTLDLHSPYFFARHRETHGAFLAPLDARRAAGEFEAAAVLYRGHGYPADADRAEAAWREAAGAEADR